MLELSFKIIQYVEPVINAQGEETAETVTYRDYVKLDDPCKGQVYLTFLAFEKKGKQFWAFADATNIPANRYLAVTAFITLSQVEATKEDLKEAFRKIGELLRGGDTEKALMLSDKCQQVVILTDPLQKWLNLATAFLFYSDENPLFYDNKVNKEKLKLINSLSNAEKKIMAEWTREYFDRIMSALLRQNPECFVESEDARDFFGVLEDLSQNEKEMKDFLNAVAAKSSFERDRLLMYPIKTLYDDMAIFIRQSEKIKELYDKN